VYLLVLQTRVRFRHSRTC